MVDVHEVEPSGECPEIHAVQLVSPPRENLFIGLKNDSEVACEGENRKK